MLHQSTPSERLFYAAHVERMNRLWPAKVCVPPKPKPAPVVLKQEITNDQFRAAWEILEGKPKYVDGITRSEAIKRSVCDYYEISCIDLISDRRTAPLIKPRHVAMYLMKHTTVLSVPQIGRLLGGRDHTTILYGVSKIERLAKDDKSLATDIAYLKQVIGA